jgi:hypothetical protein
MMEMKNGLWLFTELLPPIFRTTISSEIFQKKLKITIQQDMRLPQRIPTFAPL